MGPPGGELPKVTSALLLLLLLLPCLAAKRAADAGGLGPPTVRLRANFTFARWGESLRSEQRTVHGHHWRVMWAAGEGWSLVCTSCAREEVGGQMSPDRVARSLQPQLALVARVSLEVFSSHPSALVPHREFTGVCPAHRFSVAQYRWPFETVFQRGVGLGVGGLDPAVLVGEVVMELFRLPEPTFLPLTLVYHGNALAPVVAHLGGGLVPSQGGEEEGDGEEEADGGGVRTEVRAHQEVDTVSFLVALASLEHGAPLDELLLFHPRAVGSLDAACARLGSTPANTTLAEVGGLTAGDEVHVMRFSRSAALDAPCGRGLGLVHGEPVHVMHAESPGPGQQVSSTFVSGGINWRVLLVGEAERGAGPTTVKAAVHRGHEWQAREDFETTADVGLSLSVCPSSLGRSKCRRAVVCRSFDPASLAPGGNVLVPPGAVEEFPGLGGAVAPGEAMEVRVHMEIHGARDIAVYGVEDQGRLAGAAVVRKVQIKSQPGATLAQVLAVCAGKWGREPGDLQAWFLGGALGGAGGEGGENTLASLRVSHRFPLVVTINTTAMGGAGGPRWEGPSPTATFPGPGEFFNPSWGGWARDLAAQEGKGQQGRGRELGRTHARGVLRDSSLGRLFSLADGGGARLQGTAAGAGGWEGIIAVALVLGAWVAVQWRADPRRQRARTRRESPAAAASPPSPGQSKRTGGRGGRRGVGPGSPRVGGGGGGSGGGGARRRRGGGGGRSPGSPQTPPTPASPPAPHGFAGIGHPPRGGGLHLAATATDDELPGVPEESSPLGDIRPEATPQQPLAYLSAAARGVFRWLLWPSSSPLSAEGEEEREGGASDGAGAEGAGGCGGGGLAGAEAGQGEGGGDEAAAAGGGGLGLSEPPRWFVCPIMQEVMVDPVFADDGFSYERGAIQRWFKRHDTSPMTNVAVRNRKLTPNHMLRAAIQEYLEEERRRGDL